MNWSVLLSFAYGPSVSSPKPAVVDQGDVGDAPLHGVAGLQAGDADLAHHVLGEREIGAGGVEEAGVTEPGLVHLVRRESAGVGTHVLLEIGDGLGAIERDARIGLIFVAPAIAAGPLRFRRTRRSPSAR